MAPSDSLFVVDVARRSSNRSLFRARPWSLVEASKQATRSVGASLSTGITASVPKAMEYGVSPLAPVTVVLMAQTQVTWLPIVPLHLPTDV